MLGVLENALKGPVLMPLHGTDSRGGLHGEEQKNGQDVTLMVFYRNESDKYHAADPSSVHL